MMTFLVDVCLFLCLESFSFERSDDLSVAPKATYSYQPKSLDPHEEYLEERCSPVLSPPSKEPEGRKRKAERAPIRDDSGVVIGCDDSSSVDDCRPRLTRRRLVSTSELPVAPPRFPTLRVRPTTKREIFQPRPNCRRNRTEGHDVGASEDIIREEAILVGEEVEMERKTASDDTIRTCENQESVKGIDGTSAMINTTPANSEIHMQQECSSPSLEILLDPSESDPYRPKTEIPLRGVTRNMGRPKRCIHLSTRNRGDILEEPMIENNAKRCPLAERNEQKELHLHEDPNSISNDNTEETTGSFLFPKPESISHNGDLSQTSSPPTFQVEYGSIRPSTQLADVSLTYPPLSSSAPATSFPQYSSLSLEILLDPSESDPYRPKTKITQRDEKPNFALPRRNGHLESEVSTCTLRANGEPTTDNNTELCTMYQQIEQNENYQHADPNSNIDTPLVSGETVRDDVIEASDDVSQYRIPKAEPIAHHEDFSRTSSPPTLTGPTEGTTHAADVSLAPPPMTSPEPDITSRQCQCSSLEPLAHLILKQQQQLADTLARIERRLDEATAVTRERERPDVTRERGRLSTRKMTIDWKT